MQGHSLQKRIKKEYISIRIMKISISILTLYHKFLVSHSTLIMSKRKYNVQVLGEELQFCLFIYSPLGDSGGTLLIANQAPEA